MKSWIIMDIDGVLADCAWREHLIKGEGWDAFHAASVNDKPCTDIIALLPRFWPLDIVAITGRPEKWRQLTQEWLFNNGVLVAELLMRPNKDFRPSPVCKIDLAQDFFEGDASSRVVCAFDDREDVVAAFKALGITALQVHGRSYG